MRVRGMKYPTGMTGLVLKREQAQFFTGYARGELGLFVLWFSNLAIAWYARTLTQNTPRGYPLQKAREST